MFSAFGHRDLAKQVTLKERLTGNQNTFPNTAFLTAWPWWRSPSCECGPLPPPKLSKEKRPLTGSSSWSIIIFLQAPCHAPTVRFWTWKTQWRWGIHSLHLCIHMLWGFHIDAIAKNGAERNICNTIISNSYELISCEGVVLKPNLPNILVDAHQLFCQVWGHHLHKAHQTRKV